ncbi:TetR/AcrR family transcriptional regulator [Salinisphaera aquimarina]|uniref:TetR/AcrR family transcriptional regulator n=1 Tax=Salinisphaera aquimarina TaxID=2094031 RepID=A0ABV7ETJ0_9GAMM
MSQASDHDVDARPGKAELILNAAKRLFIEHGFGATSMDAIAAEAGVSKVTVYAHYNNKQALFAATTRRECRRVTTRMAIACEVDELPLDRALARIAASFIDAVFAPESLALLRMVLADVSRFPELGAIFYDSAPGLTLASVADYFERMRELGLIEAHDCELAAAQFLGTLRGDLHLRALLGQSVSADRLEAMAAEAVQTFVARYARR